MASKDLSTTSGPDGEPLHFASQNKHASDDRCSIYLASTFFPDAGKFKWSFHCRWRCGKEFRDAPTEVRHAIDCSSRRPEQPIPPSDCYDCNSEPPRRVTHDEQGLRTIHCRLNCGWSVTGSADTVNENRHFAQRCKSNSSIGPRKCICGRSFQNEHSCKQHATSHHCPLALVEEIQGHHQCICGSTFDLNNSVALTKHVTSCELYTQAFDEALADSNHRIAKTKAKQVKQNKKLVSDAAEKRRLEEEQGQLEQNALKKTKLEDRTAEVQNLQRFPFRPELIVLRALQDCGTPELYWPSGHPDDQYFFRYWIENGYDDFLESCIESRNKLYLQFRDHECLPLSLDRPGGVDIGNGFLQCLCPGTLGSPCPFSVWMSQSNTFVIPANGSRHLNLDRKCFLCSYVMRQDWQKRLRSRMDNGERLCAVSFSCPNKAYNGMRVCKKHHLEIVARRDRMKVASSTPSTRSHASGEMHALRKGLKFSVKNLNNFNSLMLHLESLGPVETPEWALMQSLHKLGEVYYIDTEFAGALLTQVAFVNSKGEMILNAVIDYGEDINALYERVAHSDKFVQQYRRNSLEKFYGPSQSVLAQAIPRLTPEKIAQQCKDLGIKNIVEWSSNFCDIDHFRAIVEDNSVGYEAPDRSNSCRALHLVANALKLRGEICFGLMNVDGLLFPEQSIAHHYAHLDAYKLWRVMNCLFEMVE